MNFVLGALVMLTGIVIGAALVIASQKAKAESSE